MWAVCYLSPNRVWRKWKKKMHVNREERELKNKNKILWTERRRWCCRRRLKEENNKIKKLSSLVSRNKKKSKQQKAAKLKIVIPDQFFFFLLAHSSRIIFVYCISCASLRLPRATLKNSFSFSSVFYFENFILRAKPAFSTSTRHAFTIRTWFSHNIIFGILERCKVN